MKLCDKRKELLEANGHLLVMGGPGAGKTTISLLKANWLIDNGKLLPGQKVLFLSFARSTITNIQKTTKTLIPEKNRKLMTNAAQ